MMKFVFCSLIVILISGCAKTDPSLEWRKINSDSGEYVSVNGECKAQSYKQIPHAATSDACGSEINIANNGSVSGGSGIFAGYCRGRQMKFSRELSEAREEVYEACMYNKGWVKDAN